MTKAVTPTCGTCPRSISRQNRSGRCKSCLAKARYADPVWRAKHAAAHRAACETPEHLARKKAAAQKRSADPAYRAKMSRAKRRALADPVKRANVSAAASKNLREWHATTDRDWSEWHKARWARWRAEDESRRAAEISRINSVDPDAAASFLGRWAPTYRCDEHGRPCRTSGYWRFGRAVLTRRDVAERALAKGYTA